MDKAFLYFYNGTEKLVLFTKFKSILYLILKKF